MFKPFLFIKNNMMNTHALNLQVNSNLKPIVYPFPPHSLRSPPPPPLYLDSYSIFVIPLLRTLYTLYYMHSSVNMSFI